MPFLPLVMNTDDRKVTVVGAGPTGLISRAWQSFCTRASLEVLPGGPEVFSLGRGWKESSSKLTAPWDAFAASVSN